MVRTVHTQYFFGIRVPELHEDEILYPLPFVSQGMGYQRDDSLRRKVLGVWYPRLQNHIWTVTDPNEVQRIKEILQDTYPDQLHTLPSTKKWVMVTLEGCKIIALLAGGGGKYEVIESSAPSPKPEYFNEEELDAYRSVEDPNEEASVSKLLDIIQAHTIEPSLISLQLLMGMNQAASRVERAFIWILVLRYLRIDENAIAELLQIFGYNEDTAPSRKPVDRPVRTDTFIKNLLG